MRWRVCSMMAAACFWLGAAPAQPVSIENANVIPDALRGSLESALQQRIESRQAPAWLGYSVPMVPSKGHICCHDDCCTGCRLEDESNLTHHSSDDQEMESRELLVLLRAESGRLQRLRTYSAGCPLDAGGLDFYWLGPVPPEQSVAYLSRFAAGADSRRISQSALMAVAYHDNDAADAALESFVQPERPVWLRKQSAFWMGAARQERGLQNLRRLVGQDASIEVRKQAVFGISLQDSPQAESELLRLARQSEEREVRRQAIFWLGQKAGRKAVETLTDAVENDPEVEIQLQAVFALSQMPSEEGIPHLIRIARTHSSPQVRKRAIFWLGQTGSQQALEFFEEVLSGGK